MNIIDKCANNSKLKEINAAPKIIFGLISLGICLYSNNLYVVLSVLATMIFITIKISGVAIKTYFKLLKIPLAFIVVSILTIIISITKEPNGIITISFFGYFLTVSKANLNLAYQLFLKAFSSVSCLYFISLTTPLFEIIYFLNEIKIPRFLTEIMLLMYNFIFILFDTMETIRCSQTIRLGYKNLRTSYKSTTTLATSIFIKAFKHSEDLYISMEARLFNGEIKLLKNNKKCPASYYIFFSIYLIVLLLIEKSTEFALIF